MFVNGGGKRFGFGVTALAALVLGGVGFAAGVLWLRDGGMAPGVLAGVLLPLALVAGPIVGLRAHSRMRLQAVLDRFADRELAQERQRQGKRLPRETRKVRKESGAGGRR
jgi:hypothetical protein